MEIENKDLKEEDKTSQDNGQPEKKETDESDEDNSTEEESEEEESEKEETVQISKSELEKLQKDSKDKENYKQGLLAMKRKSRTIPGAEPAEKKKEDDEFKEEEFVTKQDFQRQIEKSAIREASKNPEVDENWDAIMEFYNARHGKDATEDILTDIEIAHKTWKAQQPSKEPEEKDDEDKKSTSDLAKDAGLGKGKDKGNIIAPKKSILPKKEKMSEWYK